MAARAGVQVVIIQRTDFIFNICRHFLVAHSVEERSRYPLGLADKTGMRIQEMPQESGAFIRLQALKSTAPVSCCPPLRLIPRSHLPASNSEANIVSTCIEL